MVIFVLFNKHKLGSCNILVFVCGSGCGCAYFSIYLVCLISNFTPVVRLRQNQCRNESVQAQVGGKDLNQNSSYEKCITGRVHLTSRVTRKAHLFPRGRHTGLCSDSACSSIGCNTNGQSARQGAQATTQSCR